MSGSSIVSVPPSQYWEGDDGSWSTFLIQVGTPAQAVRLLPGTSATAADAVWVILDEGCSQLNTNLTDCRTKRGGIFARNASTSWSVDNLPNDGLLNLDSFAERALGLTGNAGYFGFDTVKLGDASAVSLKKQVVAGIATNDYFLGSLGLSPQPFNYTTLDSPIPSLLGSLRNGTINSTSWAYTAGKYYADPPLFGSLHFGGYDASRSTGSAVRVPFYNDESRDLLLGVRSIKIDSTSLLPNRVNAFLNSLVPDMWLPLEACQLFEKELGLTWNSQSQRYFVSDELHSKLLTRNPTFSFDVGTTFDGASTTIHFPYAAFDLNLTGPYSGDRYFPLKRASNSTQYTLGRAFFQEAYVVADYDGKTFNISQASTPGSGTQSQLVALNQTVSTPSDNHSGLPAGAIAGIVVGVVLLLAVLAGLAFWLSRRRKAKQRRAVEKMTDETAAEEYPMDKKMAEPEQAGPAELPGRGESVPLLVRELDGKGTAVHEMAVPKAELASGESDRHEMEVTEKRAQLEGSEPQERWELPG